MNPSKKTQQYFASADKAVKKKKSETTDLSATIRRSVPDPKEMSEEELERNRQHQDYIYHAIKERGGMLND